MTAVTLFFVLMVTVAGLAAAAYGVALWRPGRLETHPGEQPAWCASTWRYYAFALLFKGEVYGDRGRGSPRLASRSSSL